MGLHVTARVKDKIGAARTLDDGRPGGFYIPCFRNLKERNPKFIRCYGFEGDSGTPMLPESPFETLGFGKAEAENLKAYISAG